MVSGSMGVSGFDGIDEIYGLCIGSWGLGLVELGPKEAIDATYVMLNLK